MAEKAIFILIIGAVLFEVHPVFFCTKLKFLDFSLGSYLNCDNTFYHCVDLQLAEPELSGAEGRHRRPVPHWFVSRPPGGAMGRHRESGDVTTTARRRHSDHGAHAQVWSVRTREQILHKPRLSDGRLQCSKQVRNLGVLPFRGRSSVTFNAFFLKICSPSTTS